MDRHSLRRAELSWEGNTLVFTNYEDPTAPTAAYLTTLDGWYGGVGISAEATQRAVHHGQVAAKGQRTGRSLTLGAQMYFEHEGTETLQIALSPASYRTAVSAS